jgi:large subunit ribosomal protein L19e
MKLKKQKTLAARIMKCGRDRVWMDPSRVADAAEAITAEDIRKFIKDGVIVKTPKRGVSNFRKKKIAKQKLKGRRRDRGSKKGTLHTRTPKKRTWIKKIRALRDQLTKLRDENSIARSDYRKLYMKAKSGFFRSRAHLMFYLERNELLKKGGKVVEKEKK